jgi:flagellar motor switch protein FliM
LDYGDRTGPASLLTNPDRDAASVLPALEDLFRAAARQVRNRLVNRAGAEIPVRLGVAQISTIGEILEDHESRDGAAYATFRAHPLGFPGMVLMQGQLLSRIVGVLLGEDMDDEPPPYRVRAVTALELRIARRVCSDVLNGLASAWPGNGEVAFNISQLGGSSRIVDGLAPGMPVVSASLDFGRPDDPFGLLVVSIPAQATSDLRTEPEQVVLRAPQTRRLDRVMPVKLDLSAELTNLRLPLSELKALKVGSTIDLGPPREAVVKAGGQPVLYGEAGNSRGVQAMKITRRAMKETPEEPKDEES